MTEAKKERVKLFATYLNNLAVASIVIGVLPLMLGTTGLSGEQQGYAVVIAALLGIALSYLLRLLASSVLGDLDRS